MAIYNNENLTNNMKNCPSRLKTLPNIKWTLKIFCRRLNFNPNLVTLVELRVLGGNFVKNAIKILPQFSNPSIRFLRKGFHSIGLLPQGWRLHRQRGPDDRGLWELPEVWQMCLRCSRLRNFKERDKVSGRQVRTVELTQCKHVERIS